MKLSKLLLGAIVAGITVPALTSCNKDRYKILPVKEDKAKTTTNTPETIKNHDNCPACGMG
jgi:hypothetical protein